MTPAHAVSRGTGKHVVNATFGAAPASERTVNGKKQLAVDGRPYFTFGTTPGSRLGDHLAVLNISYRPETLQVYTVDAISASDGTISYASQSAPRKGAGAWMSVGTPHGSGVIHVKPRSTVILPVRVVVPANAPPGDHVGAVIVSLSGRVSGTFGQNSKQKVKLEQRLAVKALFRVTGPLHPGLRIEALHAGYSGPIDPFAKGIATVNYTVHNDGNVVLGGPQAVTVHGLFGESVAASHVPDIPPLLPDASYPVSIRIAGVYPEIYTSAKVSIHEVGLAGDIDPGLHKTTATTHFWAIPWILIALVLILLLAILSAILRRRRGRRSPVVPEPVPQGVTR